jgi:hypothetical protein
MLTLCIAAGIVLEHLDVSPIWCLLAGACIVILFTFVPALHGDSKREE